MGGRCKDGDRRAVLFGLAVGLRLVHPADDLGMLCGVVDLPLGCRAARRGRLTQPPDSLLQKKPQQHVVWTLTHVHEFGWGGPERSRNPRPGQTAVSSPDLLEFTESQNHRMVGVGRDLCGSSRPTLLPKQGHPEQAVEDLVQAGLEYLQRRRLHSLAGQPGPGLHHPQSEEVLPHVQVELPLLQFVPVAPCPVTGHY